MLFYSDYLMLLSAILFYVMGFRTMEHINAVFGYTYLFIGTGAFAFFGFRVWSHFKIRKRIKEAKERGEDILLEYSEAQKEAIISNKMEHNAELTEAEKKLAERFALQKEKPQKEQKKERTKEDPPSNEDLFGV